MKRILAPALWRTGIAGIGLLMMLPLAARASDGPGSTGAEYITLPVGAKSIAMGETKAALPGDPFSWIASPATMHFMHGSGVGLFHSEWIVDTRSDNLSYTHRVNGKFMVCGGFIFTYRPDIQGYDESGTPTKELKSNNYQMIVGLGFTPIRQFTSGLNIKYFREKLDEWSAGGAAIDLGALYAFERPDVSVGLAFQNLGPDVRFDGYAEPLPLTIRFGASHLIVGVPEKVRFRYAFDLVKPRFESVYLSGGAELELYKNLSLRVGYCGQENRAGNGLTVGGGLAVGEKITVDYAYTPYGDLGTFHRISLFFKLY